MEERIKNFDTPEKCEIFAKNCIDRGREDLAILAKQRAFQLRAEAYGAKSDAEREALEAVYAYEEHLRVKHGRNTSAARTWQRIKKHGVIEAVENAVNRNVETQGFTALVDMGLEKFTFEAVIIRHPNHFSEDVLKISKDRMKNLNG